MGHHKFFIACCLSWAGISVQAQSIGAPKTLEDEVNGYMKPLIRELDERMRYEAEKYPIEGLGLRGVTLYTYGPENELLEEKGLASSGYSRILYRNGKKIEKTYVGGETVSLERYDEHQNLVEKRDYYTDRGREKKEVYRFETHKNLTGDSITTLRYTNEQIDRRTLIIEDSLTGKTETRLYYFDRTEPQSIWEVFSTPDRKNILRNTYRDFTSEYYSVSESGYSPEGMLLWSVDSSKYGKSEYVYHYNAQGLKEKGEYKKNGQLEWWYMEEYDTAGHLLKTSGYGPNGLIYVCAYAYDERGNKLSYLYYYRGH